MYVTTRFIGTKRGDLNYLFFLLTEDYIREAKQIMSSLTPLLTKFARDLGADAALVTPFQGDEKSTLGDALDKFRYRSDYDKRGFTQKLPSILVIDVDFDAFDPRYCNHLLISLRDSMNEYGQVKVFEVQELLDELVLGARINYLFQHMGDFIKEQRKDSRWSLARDIVEIKPKVFGISVDIRKALELIKGTKERLKLITPE
jgi:hypothetical protein